MANERPVLNIVSIVLILLLGIQAYPQEYLERRAKFVDRESSLRLGQNLTLNYRESLVNHYLMVQKELAIEASRLTNEPYLASRHFFQVKEEIEQTSIFDIIRMMPKGGILHLHDASIVPLEWVVKNLTYLPNLYTMARQGDRPRQFRFSDTPLTKDSGWHSVTTVREAINSQSGIQNGSSPVTFDNMLLSEWSLYTPDPYNTYKSANQVWDKFGDYFNTISGLRTTLQAVEYYLRRALEIIYEDGVQYFELRDGDVFSANGTDLTDEYMEIVDRVVTEFQAKHPDFLGVKFILTGYRGFTEDRMQVQVDRVLQRMRKFPHLVKGFDMDAHEDVNHRIRFYLDELLENGTAVLPYFFHAGETSWTQKTDMNLVDAILLNATRIGHVFTILNHPMVMEEVRAKGIVLEVQPVSNQVLGLVSDQRNHPAAQFFANNDRVVISSDDFATWGALPLSHDFYIAFMGIGSTKDDLRLMKQLAMNSLKYSTMTDAEKGDALVKWQKRWTSFIDDVITKYHLL